MARFLLAQLLLQSLGLGPRGGAAVRVNVAPAQLDTGSASLDLGQDCPLAMEWQEKCYKLLGSPLEQRTSNRCQHEDVELANGDKVKCKKGYVCTDQAKSKIVPGVDGKTVGWKLSHCDGISGSVKVCMAPPPGDEHWHDVCASKPEEEELEPVASQPIEPTKKSMDDYSCHCTSWEADTVQAVWVRKSLVDHRVWNVTKKLWAGGGIDNFDDNESRCACNAQDSWTTRKCTSNQKSVFPPSGFWKYWWSEWQTKCNEECEKSDATVDRACG